MGDDQTVRILASLDRLEAGQAKLEAGLAKLEAGHDALHAELGTLRGDVMARIDRVQDGVAGLRDDIVVNFGRADRVARHSRDTDDQVRALSDEVSSMQRQIQRLQSDVRTLRGEA